MASDSKVVFVAQEFQTVLGAYTTKEAAMAACEEWLGEPANDLAPHTTWHRYDGAWRRHAKNADGCWLEHWVTEVKVDDGK